ncbi:PD-(D/E)XK nuclease family protein [Selenihalanaerobacter shriftii]|uniref:ATP-dependent helicase/DNAse subunit B n=1 Tax=Selenihalanaerobacter shriftii TaxID=142842 RepID=A0A1T4NDP9_9FIRM|nr:PD-(D/E)XK nuclease family protein [Selenihalanaerobacter shriftii]SJZ77245.1 ATP-dependent helicase/DNAse subunit B [Selenihalanaerobacter shriftii]
MSKRLIYSDINSVNDIGLNYYLENDNLLYILPYYEMKATMREKIWQSEDSQAVVLQSMLSIDQLFKDIYYKVDGKRQIINNDDLKYLLFQLLQEEDYDYFDESSTDYILEFINEIDAELVNLEERRLDKEILVELKDIYYSLKDRLDELNFITKWQSYQFLIENLTKADFVYLYPEVKNIFLDRVYIFRPAELELILILADWVEEMTILLDYNPDKKKLFSDLDPLFEKLKEAGFVIEDYTEKNNELIKKIFSNEVLAEDEKYIWQDELEKELKIIDLPNPVQELEVIAKKIRALAKEGENLSRIGIAFSTPGNYRPHLDRIFTQYNLPYKRKIPMPLISVSLIKELVTVLDILTGDFNSQEFLALISADFINLDSPSLLSKLDQVLKEVRFEAVGWHLIKLIEDKIRSLEDDELVTNLEFIKETFKWSLSKEVSFKDFINKFINILNKFELADKLEEFKEDSEVIVAWNEFQNIIAKLNNITDEKRTLKEWVKILRQAFQEGTYTYDKSQGVEITGKIELRSGDYDYIFLAGMSHDLYPTRGQNPLDKYFKELGMELTDDQVLDRYLFVDHLLGAKKGIFITYSKSASEEKALASSCIEELRRIVKLEEMKVEDNLYSIDELQKYLGKGLKVGEQYKLIDDYSWNEDLLTKFRLLKDRNQDEFSAYNGQIEDKRNLNWLEEKFNDDYVYSADSLGSYANCPFKFLFEKIFKIRSLEFSEEIQPFERGRFLHKIMEKFYNKFSAGKVTEDNQEEAAKLLLEVTQEVLAEYPLFKESFYWQTEGERYLKDESLGIGLEKILAFERDSRIKNKKTNEFTVKEVEWDFNELELVDNYKFSGRIDRINYHEEDWLGVIDYKTGSIRNPVQMPLYIMAANEEFSEDIVYGGYYILDPSKGIGYKKLNLTNEMYKSSKKATERFNNSLEEAKENIKEYITNIKTGNFKIGEDDNGCSYCQCKFICRKEEA